MSTQPVFLSRLMARTLVSSVIFFGALFLNPIQSFSQESIKNQSKYSGNFFYQGFDYMNIPSISFFKGGYSGFLHQQNMNHSTDIYYRVNFIDLGIHNMALSIGVETELVINSFFQILSYYKFNIPPFPTLYPKDPMRSIINQMYHALGNVISLYYNSFTIANCTEVHIKPFDREKTEYAIINIISLSNYLVNINNIFRINSSSSFTYIYNTSTQKDIYSLDFYMPIYYNHLVGEVIIQPFLNYSGSFHQDSQNSIKTNYLPFIIPYLISSPDADSYKYQFAAGTEIEYRFYFLRFLRNYLPYENTYLSFLYKFMYLAPNSQELSQYHIKHVYGIGLGYSIFGIPMCSAHFIIDNDKNIGFSIFSSIYI